MKVFSLVLLLALCLLGTAPAVHAQETVNLSLAFKEVNQKGYPVITVTNNEDRPIDDLTGSFSLEDSEGTVLFSTGFSENVPGSILIGAGETKEMSLYITPGAQDRNPEGKRKLLEEPETVTVRFQAKSVTFADPTPAPVEPATQETTPGTP